jgi:hypothetical protein
MILGLEHATVCLTQDKTTNYAKNRASFLITACSQVDVQCSLLEAKAMSVAEAESILSQWLELARSA